MDVSQMTNEDFLAMSLDSIKIQTPTPPAATAQAATTTTSPSLVQEFLKGIKRSISDYKELKNDGHWKYWQRDLTSVAASHGVEDVLDETYLPTTSEEILLFEQKKKFMHSVFEKKLLTPKSRNILRQHDADKDAQLIYVDLRWQYQSGTTQKIQADNLEKKWKDFKLTAKWNNPLEKFLTLWSSRLLEYESTADITVPVDEKKRVLESAI